MARLNPLMRVLVKEARRWRLSYSQFSEYGKPARRHLGLKSARGPRLLSYAALARFCEAIDSTQNITHQIMLRLLFYTAIR